MYFDDLSPYAYHLTPHAYSQGRPIKTVLNVGWLDSEYSFSTGNPPEGFQENLKRWSIEAGACQTRGFHLCRFCVARDKANGTFRDTTTAPGDEAKDERLRNLKADISRYRKSHIFNGQVEWLGTCEMWIPGENGLIYASPDLIVHYVEEHSYLPPAEFIEAVMKPMPLDWNADAIADERIRASYTDADN